MNYPTFKVKGNPTPYNTLWVCDECGNAEWGPSLYNYPPYVQICYTRKHKNRKGKVVNRRMRRGTLLEIEEAKKALKTIIGE